MKMGDAERAFLEGRLQAVRRRMAAYKAMLDSGVAKPSKKDDYAKSLAAEERSIMDRLAATDSEGE